MPDLFTLKRLQHFVGEHREKHGRLPTLKDLAEAGFSKELVEEAKRLGLIEEFYLTQGTGAVVKGFKVRRD